MNCPYCKKEFAEQSGGQIKRIKELEQQLLAAQLAIKEATLTLAASLPDEESDEPASKTELRGCIIAAQQLLKPFSVVWYVTPPERQKDDDRPQHLKD